MPRPYLLIPLLIPILLGGCTSYRPLPLPGESAKAPPLERITVDTRSLPFPALAAHGFDASDGLDQLEAAILAVANNPDLKLARDDAAIVRAQSFAAGLLPDPQLALSGDLSNTQGPGSTRAYSAGLSYDFNALLTHSSVVRAGRADVRKTDLGLLWQEWQVASQAELLHVKLRYERKQLAVLADTETLFTDRVGRMRAALAQGLLATDAMLPNLTALQDVQRQRFELERQARQDAYDMNTLLGLGAGTTLRLQDSPAQTAPSQAEVDAAEAGLAQRRPDLLALQAGYTAQDARYRGAILAQFPALNIGLTRARDSSNVYSKAVGITLTLPFLNRNRGNIAIENATRQRLHDEYQQRLRAAHDELVRIPDLLRRNSAALVQANASVAELSVLLERSKVAYRAGNVDMLVYANARAALLAKQLEQIALRQAVAEQQVALRTLLGLDPSNPSLSRKLHE
ncbi:TolC family protein [Massilia aerilata]|uniref:TolC family protein n=1 Tax=Massilia aerilata TaxID=453817 RepID=A0ABW0S1B9_9BURK